MLKEKEILKWITADRASEQKRLAAMGLRYYDGDHDIKNYRLYYYNADGELVEDRTRSNVKIPHPFFTELVDQQVQYMLSGKEGFIRSPDPGLQAQLDVYFNHNVDFAAELYELVTGAVVKGCEYMYAYKNREGRLDFQCADSMGVIEVPAEKSSDGGEYLIYWFMQRAGRRADGEMVMRIQVWDQDETWFYIRDRRGRLIPDPEVMGPNPRGHVTFEQDGELCCRGLGFIPFFRLDNGKRRISGLRPIKEIIDDYDLHACALSNNLRDFDTPLYAVKGFLGDDLDELIQNIRVKKHIGLDENGGVEVKTVEIPYAARQVKLELDEKNIYRFGMGFNAAQVGDGNITNVVIKSRYALLDLKCSKMEIHLRQFLRRILRVVLAEINEMQGTDYGMKDVWFDFGREIMTNAADNAEIALKEAETKKVKLETMLAAETLLGEDAVKEAAQQLLSGR